MRRYQVQVLVDNKTKYFYYEAETLEDAQYDFEMERMPEMEVVQWRFRGVI